VPEISGLSVTVVFFSSICLGPFAVYSVPQSMPSALIGFSVIALGVMCSGVVYLMFYRLKVRIGSHKTITSTTTLSSIV
jgi:amino acid transporter